MLNKNLNKKIFDKDVAQVPIRKGWNANTWSITRPELFRARRGRGIFHQKNICDLVKVSFYKTI